MNEVVVDTSSGACGHREHESWRSNRHFTWVTTSGRALPVRVDVPPGRTVRGAVVLVPSLGRESVVSYRTVRSMAVRAARAGLVACTFSLSGDGDSQDLRPGDNAVDAWLDDIRAVREFAATLVGAPAQRRPVHVIGLRLGAALVEQLHHHDVADREGVNRVAGSFVAWEPISGRSFLRHHTGLRRTGVPGEEVEDGVELDGFHLTAALAGSVRGLPASRRTGAGVLTPAGLSDGELYVRFEPDRRASVRLALGATYFAHVPLESIDEIIGGLPLGTEAPLEQWAPVKSATFCTVDETGTPRAITETHVAVGRRGVPGIVTRMDGTAPVAGLTLSAMGSEVKWGPGRVWTRAARDLASHGVISLRADRSGIGDDVDPDAALEPPPYTQEAAEDTAAGVDVLRSMLPPGAPVTGTGVCAGSWSLLVASCHTEMDQVVAVNPVHWNPDASLYTRAFYDHYHGSEAPGLDNPAEEERLSPAEALHSPQVAVERLKEFASREMALRLPRVRSMLRPEVPVDHVRYLLDHVREGTRLTLVLGHEEFRIFSGKGGRRAAARARRHGVPVQLIRPTDLDHSLLSERARRDVLALLRRVCTAHVVPHGHAVAA